MTVTPHMQEDYTLQVVTQIIEFVIVIKFIRNYIEKSVTNLKPEQYQV